MKKKKEEYKTKKLNPNIEYEIDLEENLINGIEFEPSPLKKKQSKIVIVEKPKKNGGKKLI